MFTVFVTNRYGNYGWRGSGPCHCQAIYKIKLSASSVERSNLGKSVKQQMIHIFPNEEKKYSKLLTNKIVALKQNEETSLYIVEKKHKIRIRGNEGKKDGGC